MQTEQCTSLREQLAQSCVSLEAAAPPGTRPPIASRPRNASHTALQAYRRQGCRRLCSTQPRKHLPPRPSIWARTASTNNGVSPPQAAKPVLDAPWTDMAHHHSSGFTQGHHLLQRQPKALRPPTRLRLFAGTANPVSQLPCLVQRCCTELQHAGASLHCC